MPDYYTLNSGIGGTLVPEFVPTNYGMPWRARAKRDGVKYHLGYFRTKQEAIDAEEKFAEVTPRKKNRRGVNQAVARKAEDHGT